MNRELFAKAYNADRKIQDIQYVLKHIEKMSVNINYGYNMYHEVDAFLSQEAKDRTESLIAEIKSITIRDIEKRLEEAQNEFDQI